MKASRVRYSQALKVTGWPSQVTAWRATSRTTLRQVSVGTVLPSLRRVTARMRAHSSLNSKGFTR